MPKPETKLDPVQPLTIKQAKRGLAKTFGVDVNAIEVTIRG
ncbi:MAG TPA: hypothetical protein V6D15_24735 [Oculatellaceae cyanobacterium]|jgi:hypothetical protein